MPNHIHLIIFIHGTSRTPSPTIHNLYNRLKTCNIKIFDSIFYSTRHSSNRIYVTAYAANHDLPFRNLKNARMKYRAFFIICFNRFNSFKNNYLLSKTSFSYFSTSPNHSPSLGAPQRVQYSSQISPQGNILTSSCLTISSVSLFSF